MHNGSCIIMLDKCASTYTTFLGERFLCCFFLSPDLRCWFTNRHWCQLLSQQSASALAGNQLLPNALLERDGKALIDLVDGLSLRSVVLVGVTLYVV
jgi:hypothetical protein